ncbi:MAG TPA: hypothetical protein VMF52_20545 [Steroidobacteraceae bacterium]|nr:hypothetical protein [Steroidobacteraceae bacterium]
MNYAPSEIYTQLREQAFATTAKGVGAVDSVYGFLMETGYPEAVVTLVAMADGSASLYFSNGGGIIGAGEHEGPAVAARTLIAFAAHNIEKLAPAKSTPLPTPDRTRFYVLTARGILTAEASEDDLGEDRHVLSPLFYAAQELISEMRQVDESRK